MTSSSAKKENPRNAFEEKDFDPIAYINKKFPDENSLSGLDSEIDRLKKELSEINSELIGSIHEHAILNSELQEEIKKSNTTTMEIIKEVALIKEKAEKSENLVYEMCKDIKSLDTAKRNLTFSITALKKFIMMITTVDKLREYCEKRKYREVGNLLLAFDDFSNYFKKYENVSQIVDLYREKDGIVRELKLQIEEDIISYGKGSSIMNLEAMKEVCEVIEALGSGFKNEIVKKISSNIIKPYQELFSHSENSSLENTERRYGWLWRNLKEFDNTFGKIFPEYWGMHCHLIYEFCGITRIQITETLEKRAQSAEVAVLMKALESTIKFEVKIQEDMKKEYSVYLQEAKNYYRERNELETIKGLQEKEKNKSKAEPANSSGPASVDKLSEKVNENILKGLTQSNIRIEFMITSLPKFKGSISDSFEPYLRPYVEKEEQQLVDNILKSLQNDDIDHSSEIKIMNSSLYLFNYIKTTLKRASQFSRSQAMFDIYRVIKRSLKLYADELVKKIAHEEKVTKTKDEQLFISVICFIVNTAEYCKDTLNGLAENVRQNLDSPFCEKVEFEAEEDIFAGMLNRGVESLTGFLDGKLEAAFSNMLKLNWERMEKVGDISDYVKEIKSVTGPFYKIIKCYLSEVYFYFFMNKVAVLMNNKFLNNCYKCKKFGELGLQQLQLDLFEIKTDMINGGKYDTEKAHSSHGTLTNFVNKTMMKSENVLKLLAMNTDKFSETFQIFFPDATATDLDKILTLKGLRRTDVPALIKAKGL